MNTIASNPAIVGVDLAKNRFAFCALDADGRVLRRGELSRSAFAQWLANLPAGTIVAMEACSGAHHWARRSLTHGLNPKLMAAQFVAPFRKSQRTKNDRNDAEAIATAARQGNMRFVSIKDEAQQARLSWHRAREGFKAEALALSNRMRGLLAEFGIVLAQGKAALQRTLADTDLRAGLPASFNQLLDQLHAHWQAIQAQLVACERQIAVHTQQDARSRRLQQMPGIGPLSADAVVATIGDGREFKNGRQLSAWMGLTPTQHSSGGKTRLGSIGQRGDAYLRTLLMQGARSCVQQARRVSPARANAEQCWILSLSARMPFTKVLVAIANRHARQLWAMLARGQDYDPDAWLRHPWAQRQGQATPV